MTSAASFHAYRWDYNNNNNNNNNDKRNLTVFTISVDDVHMIDTRVAYCQQLTLTVATAPVIVNINTKRCNCTRYCQHKH